MRKAVTKLEQIEEDTLASRVYPVKLSEVHVQ
jgi:hypothetical protein